MKRYPLFGAALLALCSLAPAGPAPGEPSAAAAEGPWRFRVLLDGEPIGQHRFGLHDEGAQRTLRSEARFDVKLLGLTVYRYRHEATERWQGGCLVELTARTDDDGNISLVQARRHGAGLHVRSPGGEQVLEGCVFTFAYWNPAMLEQARLLNAQTGEAEAVRIESLGDSTVEARGGTVPARRYRITGPERPVELWYSPEGDWLALESTVSGGRRLSYRRE